MIFSTILHTASLGIKTVKGLLNPDNSHQASHVILYLMICEFYQKHIMLSLVNQFLQYRFKLFMHVLAEEM